MLMVLSILWWKFKFEVNISASQILSLDEFFYVAKSFQILQNQYKWSFLEKRKKREKAQKVCGTTLSGKNYSLPFSPTKW